MSQVEASGKRQKLIKELQSKILIVEEAIEQVTAIQNTLEDNAEQVKSEIHASVSGHLEQLRNREEQLLRQVDVLTSNQMSLLRTQYAKLYHCLGNLQSSLQCVEDQPNDFNFSTVITKDMESVTRMKSQNQPFFAFLLDNEVLKTSIQEFGKIEVSGTLLSFPPPQDSVCLPARVEEYEDGDHHILYKTLEELKLEKENCVKLKVAFPKISGQLNDWLCSTAEKSDVECCGAEKSTVDSIWDVINEVKSRDVSIHLKQWLHQMQNADELDELEEFQMLDLASERQSRSTSDSIEIVSECSTQWLSKCYNVDGYQKECFPCPSSSPCCCSNKNIEIENLGSMPCRGYQNSNVTDAKKEYKMWLVGSLNGASQRAKFIPSVAEVCRANEPCSSFFECVYDENCAAVCIQQPGQFSDRTNLSPLVAPMLNILYSNASEWVTKQHSKEILLDEGEDVKHPARIISFLKNFHQSDDIRSWLPHKKNYENSSFSCDVSTNMELDNNVQDERWLSESMETEQTSLQEKISAMFKFYFEPLDSNLWLHAQENCVATNELENKLKWLALSKNNSLEYVSKCSDSSLRSFGAPLIDEVAWLSSK